MTNDEDTTRYKVVVNDEGQYSIWQTDREAPLGWREEGTAGTRSECLVHIDRIWTDMRPLSLRKQTDSTNPNVTGSTNDREQ